ncbi:Fic/DOC family N-terminal domain-containing protein [Mitsuaria sp. GD03876]|uniref:Fic family protein n=1 Tax=Mitsuaria sp. GD03876 TaxID=2975399 RepID=UPI002449C659|nr:Fic/DOC family N-terminal domain-containing protein [Mitsuaria sp. GD03876]MDH0867096.1 Fic family protein [Mitsuaria sp. GD03876]
MPAPLPPRPSLIVDTDLQDRLDEALVRLGRLDGAALVMPDAAPLLYSYARKEAVMSSRIEGTQSSLSDLMLYEADGAPGVPIDDAREVSCHVAAIDQGLAQLKAGMPLCTRLMNDMHATLMRHGRGTGKAPGEIRRTQNWIGGPRADKAVFVPPPAHRLNDCLSDLEKFLNDQPRRHGPLAKAALAHLQFETIHPYLDGNGRLGRLLIPLILVREGILCEPVLFLSLFFRSHRDDYYELLQNVRLHGDWEEWLWFFTTGVSIAATQAFDMALSLTALTTMDGERLQPGRASLNDVRLVHRVLSGCPVASEETLVEKTALAPEGLHRAVGALIDLGIVRELCGTAGGRIFVYTACLELLNHEPP